jgi:glutamate--cysteine ligase
MIFITEYLSGRLDNKKELINQWFETKFALNSQLIYSSIDVRRSNFKMAPVDANLFPAGFNNLSNQSIEKSKLLLKDFLDKDFPDINNIILVAEAHTRNRFYADNLSVLNQLILSTGINLTLASLKDEKISLITTQLESLSLEPLASLIPKIDTKKTLIILNNDLSEGLPHDLDNPDLIMTPPAYLGWFKRKKSKHFELYNQITQEFCQEFAIDPFFLTTSFMDCNDVNFKTLSGLECVALKVEKMIHALKQKYSEYEINHDPYIVVKSDSGTYGMAVMSVTRGDEIIEINKRGRNKMYSGKNGTITNNVIIQEGIETSESFNGLVSESLIYSVSNMPVSLIARHHSEKGVKSNLNSVGMNFEEIDSCQQDSKFFYHYLVAKLTNLAMIQEKILL